MSGVLDAIINLFRYAVSKYREPAELLVAHRDTLPSRIDCFDFTQHERATRRSRNEEVRSAVIVVPIKPLDGILQFLELLFDLRFILDRITIRGLSTHCHGRSSAPPPLRRSRCLLAIAHQQRISTRCASDLSL